jgi:hypothetical protein
MLIQIGFLFLNFLNKSLTWFYPIYDFLFAFNHTYSCNNHTIFCLKKKIISVKNFVFTKINKRYINKKKFILTKKNQCSFLFNNNDK